MKPLRHNTLRWRILLCAAFLLATTALQARRTADDDITPRAVLKTNLLYDATTTPNLGLEVWLGRHSSAQLFYGLNPWNFGHEKRLRHWSLMPEYRYWIGPRRLQGHFVGLHALTGEYNIGGLGPIATIRHNRREGWYAGGGLTYGYAWRVRPRWNVEAAIGVGYARLHHDKYVNEPCGRPLAATRRNYFGPTKLALNVGYVFGPRRHTASPAVLVPDTVVIPEVQPPYQPQFRLAFFTPPTEAEKIRELSGQAFLDFPVNQTVIYPDYRANKRELDRVIQTIDTVRNDPNTRITWVGIHGYASPEGSYANNTRLARERAAAFKDYVRTLISLPDSTFHVQSTPEDWAGLLRILADSAALYPHAAQLLAIAADTATAPDLRDQRMKRLYPQDYDRLLRNVYPALRHSDYLVRYVVRPFTVEETRLLIATKPQQLSLAEMFRLAQTCQPGTPEYNDVFMTAVRMYPTDQTANLNAAVIALQKHDTADAERYLQRAGDSPEAQNARAVLLARQGRLREAEALLQGISLPEAHHNLQEVQRAIQDRQNR